MVDAEESAAIAVLDWGPSGREEKRNPNLGVCMLFWGEVFRKRDDIWAGATGSS